MKYVRERQTYTLEYVEFDPGERVRNIHTYQEFVVERFEAPDAANREDRDAMIKLVDEVTWQASRFYEPVDTPPAEGWPHITRQREMD